MNNNDLSPRSRSKIRVDKKKSGAIKFDSNGREIPNSDKKLGIKHSKTSSDPSKGTGDNKRSLKQSIDYKDGELNEGSEDEIEDSDDEGRSRRFGTLSPKTTMLSRADLNKDGDAENINSKKYRSKGGQKNALN